MPKVISRTYTTGFFGGAEFKQELDEKTQTYVGAADVPANKLKYFKERPDTFEVVSAKTEKTE